MERCGFFDAHLVGNEYDRVYLAEQFASYFASFIGNGIFAGKSNELQVLSIETPTMQVRIQEGQGWMNGYWYENMSECYLPIEVADGVLSRIDTVVLRLGMAERNIFLAIKKGTPSYEPVAPEITRNEDYYELQLATIWVGAGYTNIKQSDITDTRLDSNVCGLVTGLIKQLDTTDYGNQLQAFMVEYMEKAGIDYEQFVAGLAAIKADADGDYDKYKEALAALESSANEDYQHYNDRLDELKVLAAQDKDNYFANLQELYALCDAAYRDFLSYLENLKTDGNNSLDSLKSWIERLKQASTAEINHLIEELRGLIGEEIVPQIILRLVDLEDEMPKKIPKPVNSDLTEGVVYLNPDGTTKLLENREQLNRFKYSIIVNNGTDANPAAIEYADDCANFIEAFGSNMNDWANTKLYKEYFRPCVIAKEDSEPKYFLQHDNMTLKEDGTPAVLDGTDGDVMIQVKKLYGKATTNGNNIKLTILNYKEDESCFCFNEIAGEEKEYVYVAALESSYNQNGVSQGSVAPIQSCVVNYKNQINIHNAFGYHYLYMMQNIDFTEPTDARSELIKLGLIPEEGYLLGYYYLTYQLYQWMFLLLYKTKDCASSLGCGVNSVKHISDQYLMGEAGFILDKPFCYGKIDNDGTEQMKFLGVENFYGHTPDLIEGAVVHIEAIEGDDNNVSVFLRLSKNPSVYDDMLDTYDEQLFCSNIFCDDYCKYVNRMGFYGDCNFAFPEVFEGASAETDWCCALVNGIPSPQHIYYNKNGNFLIYASTIYTETIGIIGEKSSPFDFIIGHSIEEICNEFDGTFRLFRYK